MFRVYNLFVCFSQLFDALKVNGDLREEDEVREKARSPRIAPSVSPGALQIRATAAPNWPRKVSYTWQSLENLS